MRRVRLTFLLALERMGAGVQRPGEDGSMLIRYVFARRACVCSSLKDQSGYMLGDGRRRCLKSSRVPCLEQRNGTDRPCRLYRRHGRTRLAGALELTSAQDVQRFARFLDRYEDEDDGRQIAQDDEEDTDDSEDAEAYRSAESTPGTPSRSSSPDSIHDRTPSPSAGPSRSHLRSLSLAIPPSELTESFSTTSLAQVLSAPHEWLTSLCLAHAESLLARDLTLQRAIAHASAHLTHLTVSELGPRVCDSCATWNVD